MTRSVRRSVGQSLFPKRAESYTSMLLTSCKQNLLKICLDQNFFSVFYQAHNIKSFGDSSAGVEPSRRRRGGLCTFAAAPAVHLDVVFANHFASCPGQLTVLVAAGCPPITSCRRARLLLGVLPPLPIFRACRRRWWKWRLLLAEEPNTRLFRRQLWIVLSYPDRAWNKRFVFIHQKEPKGPNKKKAKEPLVKM